MYQSRCFQGSKGGLGCISCHDPHKLPPPEERAAYYRRRCLTCHQETDCGLPSAARRERNRADSCADCHMSRVESRIAHHAVTDHRIVRSANAAPRDAAPPGVPPAGQVPLIHFHRDVLGTAEWEVSRDLGLALAEIVRNSPPQGKRLGPMALPLLEAAWEAEGATLWLLGRRPEALSAFEAALARAPQREEALTYAAALAAAEGRTDAAIGYWRRAIAVNPWCSPYHDRLARLLVERRQWPEAADECAAALRLNPSNLDVRLLQIRAYLNTDREDRARAELDTLLRLKPEDGEALRRWYAGQAR
jgi:tetratricopeptide (TPR) repeat protein